MQEDHNEVVVAEAAIKVSESEVKGWVVQPTTLASMMKYCRILARSSMVPEAYKNDPDTIFMIAQWGAQIGLTPFQSLMNISLIKGRPTLWGDAMRALVLKHPKLESLEEVEFYGDLNTGKDPIGYECRIKRVGMPLHVVRFIIDDAIKAKLFPASGKQEFKIARSKDGREYSKPMFNDTWLNFTLRMCQHRAFSWAARDRFSDALFGFEMRELVEAEVDMKDVTPAQAAITYEKGSGVDVLKTKFNIESNPVDQ